MPEIPHRQINLFGAPLEPPAPVGPAALPEALVSLGASLPPLLRFGTSSWGYPGWSGVVYDRPAPEALLARHGLSAYSQHPLLRCVGIDRTHYAPISAEAFAAYAAQVPETFRFLAKAHDHCTLARFPRHPRYGSRAGEQNDRFLDSAYAEDAVVGPFAEGLGKKAGPLLFQFAPMDVDALGGPVNFGARLYRFLDDLPRTTFYAVEVRNASLVVPTLGNSIAAVRGAAPALLAHPLLPDLGTQARVFGIDRFPALVIRWMLHKGYEHEAAGDAWSPFDQIQDEEPAVRTAVARLATAAVKRGRPALVIVNNIAEGCAPRSIEKLAAETVTHLPPPSP